MLNAIFYLTKNGCSWQALPHDFPPEGTVRDYFPTWRRQVRRQAGRAEEPSAGIIDSQSVKATRTSGTRGYDAGKKIKGVKRHIVVDTLGLLVAMVVHSAAVQDRDGAKLVLAKMQGHCPRLALLWADGGYAGKLIAWVQDVCGWLLQIVKRTDNLRGFVVLPRRWCGGADLWLDGPIAPAQQGLRVPPRNQRSHDSRGDDSSDAPALGDRHSGRNGSLKKVP